MLCSAWVGVARVHIAVSNAYVEQHAEASAAVLLIINRSSMMLNMSVFETAVGRQTGAILRQFCPAILDQLKWLLLIFWEAIPGIILRSRSLIYPRSSIATHGWLHGFVASLRIWILEINGMGSVTGQRRVANYIKFSNIMIKIDKTGVNILVMQEERNWDFRPHLSVKHFMMITGS